MPVADAKYATWISAELRHVFEIAFEGIAASSRHKSGVAFRFPRIARWRHDLSITDAESLAEVGRF